MKPPYALIDGYFEGMLSDEQFAELVDWLHASPDHARAFARWAQLRRQIAEQMQGEDVASVMLDEAETAANDVALSLHGSSLHGADFAEVLTRLDVKGDSEVELVDLSAQLQAAARQTREAYRADRREARQQAMQYLAGVGKDLATSPRLLAGLAALLAVAITAWALLPAGSPSEPVADQRQANPAPAPARPVAVATLTQTHDAQWAAFAPAPGDTLYAGQRLTLIEGFAEITTGQGAVAILEAPATIELLDNDNGLHLHAGKLVGICETASSKGFVVRTPHMDVTDLGTRFGVAVENTRKPHTYTHVFEGSVSVTQSGLHSDPSNPRVLDSEESLAIDATGDLAEADHDTKAQFAQALALYNRPKLAGDIHWSANVYSDKDLRQWPCNSQAVLFEEVEATVLTKDVPVTFSQPGRYEVFDESGSVTLPRGIAVRSYIVLFNPEENKNRESFETSFGSIRFRGKILGVTANTVQSQRFAESIGNASQAPLQVRRDHHWPENRGALGNDWIEVHDEGRSLSFQLKTNSSLDVFRVIVAEPEQP